MVGSPSFLLPPDQGRPSATPGREAAAAGWARPGLGGGGGQPGGAGTAGGLCLPHPFPASREASAGTPGGLRPPVTGAERRPRPWPPCAASCAGAAVWDPRPAPPRRGGCGPAAGPGRRG